MSMFYHIKQQVVQHIFPERSHVLGKWKSWILFFLGVGETVSMLKVYNKVYVAHCCTMCCTGRTNPTRQQRFQSSGSQ